MIKLGVNIDHVATVRNARGESHPYPHIAAKNAIKFGANSITIHLREDRRHINDNDLKIICSIKKIPLNLEIGPTNEMLKIALKYKPNYVCIVPEKRKEITTEGGLNLNKNTKLIKKIINKLNKSKIRTSLFINPSLKDIKMAKKLGTNCIEIHTGKISNLVKKKQNYKKELKKIKNSAKLAESLNLDVHAGHGLDYDTIKILKKISQIKEYNIGHFIIGESIQYGLRNVINNFKKILKK
tara:strand:- start:3975 stop:4694 length:720 start_codon:yes stop_codon:yes gene_type:complete